MHDLSTYTATTGQSLWLDNLSRAHVFEGKLKHAIEHLGIRGVTSNPSILDKALRESPAYYRADLRNLRLDDTNIETIYEHLIARDVQMACDLLTPLWEESLGLDGYVSWEVSPALAHDADATVAAAARLRLLAGRDNLMIKVPATEAGVHAFEELTARGYKVNVTLIFGLEQLRAVFEAHLRGLRRWMTHSHDPLAIRSVASVFLSRVDTLVDNQLNALASAAAADQTNQADVLALRGKAALALASQAYALYQSIYHGEAFADLRALGVRPQNLLWASTAAKNPAYSDLIYVEDVMLPETINTLPDATLAALADHAVIQHRSPPSASAAQAHYAQLASLGIHMDKEIAEGLQSDGLRLFQQGFDALLAQVNQ
ncbi:MAG: transaldolase [Halothiobacillaceae bacterium]|nr:transaldolase [Halothiobacillaceae bacterium]